jgi:hypothetical protein
LKLSHTIGGIVHIIIGLVIEEGWALNDIHKKTSRLLLRLILVAGTGLEPVTFGL